MSRDQFTHTTIRSEVPDDVDHMRRIITAAFAPKSHLQHKEADIVDALRNSGSLSLSLIALTSGNEIVGHIAVSPVKIDNTPANWYGLGPVSVHPSCQGQGIGSHLVQESLRRLRAMNAAGCVVSGRPAFYMRFGFEHDPSMTFTGAPAKFFQRIVLKGPPVSGKVTYHEAFDIP